MSFVDRIFPFAVGHRTEFIAVVMTGLKIAVAFGGVPPFVVDAVQSVLVPLGAATFSAKVSRLVAAQ